MDAYSISVHSSTHQKQARIYQDLKSSLHYRSSGVKESWIEKFGVVGSLSKSTLRSIDHKPHIGIIGAGLAGLRCADVLLEEGFEVTVIEGRDRVGGRVHQQTLANGHVVDMGPNWIHGTANNPILDLARQTGTTVGLWDTRSYIFDEDGRLFEAGEGERYADAMWGLVARAFKHSEDNSPDIDPQESLHDFFLREVADLIPASTDGWERKRRLVLQTAEQWGAFVGSPIHRQSLRFFWLEECIEGENLFCAGTYQKILEKVSKPALEQATIRLQTRATRFLTRQEPGEKVRVLTDGGETLEFDDVVVTAPLGWLKRNLDAFEPGLPRSLTKAIENISYGCLEKVYISFPKAFWLVPDSQGRILQGFAQWLSPNYAPASNPARWNQEVVELASLSRDTLHPTLLFYIYGEQSRQLTSTCAALLATASPEVRDKYLLDFFMPYVRLLPNYSPSSPDCAPAEVLATSWLTDDLAGHGSYGNFQVGLEHGDDDIRAMRQGLPDRGLWLAGEHTAPFVGLGTATGAYWSGESVAGRIAEAYGGTLRKR